MTSNIQTTPLPGEALNEATLTLGDDKHEAKPGTWVHMPTGQRHSIQAKTPVVMLLLLMK
jgi:quercetin dioxygenase-like cupin family protein